jgi:hypothetical protein
MKMYFQNDEWDGERSMEIQNPETQSITYLGEKGNK